MGLGTNLRVEEGLPFVKKLDKKEAKRVGRGYNYWDVKPTGDCGKDRKTGKEYARQLLEYMCRDNNTVFILGQCVKDMPRSSDMTSIESEFLLTISQYAMFTYLFQDILNKSNPFKLISFWKENITGDEIDSYLKSMVVSRQARDHEKQIKELEERLLAKNDALYGWKKLAELYKKDVERLKNDIAAIKESSAGGASKKTPAPVLTLTKKPDET